MQRKALFSSFKRKSTLYFLLVLIFLISGSVFIMQAGQNIEKQEVNKSTTFTPTFIPSTAPEIVNPWRGAFEWYDAQVVPNWPTVDSYVRYYWKDIEPTEGHYNFSLIDKELALAQSHHGKFGFRIMPADPEGVGVPDYLMALMPQGGWFLNTYANKRAYEPDWNAPSYMTRALALIDALGQHYNNDPRLGWVDMFPYGDWGEWHNYGFPNTIAPMSAANQYKLINTMIHAFSQKRVLMFTTEPAALTYALNSSSKVGIRVDCLGTADMGGAIEKLKLVPLAQDRWKTAPFVFEFCKQAEFQTALQQVETYHGAMISNGNIAPYTNYSLGEQDFLKRVYSTSGYRFILNKMILPPSITTNKDFMVTTSWSNINVAPAYNTWDVMILLKNSLGTVVWQGKSSLDLQTLLPTTNQTTGIDRPITVTDHFRLPGTITSGRYSVAVRILDPDNYYEPLNIANQGRSADGSYTLGKVTIVS